MTYKQAVDYYGSAEKLAEALGITKGAVYRWRDSDRISNKKIPWQWQCAISEILHNKGPLYPTLGPWEK